MKANLMTREDLITTLKEIKDFSVAKYNELLSSPKCEDLTTVLNVTSLYANTASFNIERDTEDEVKPKITFEIAMKCIKIGSIVRPINTNHTIYMYDPKTDNRVITVRHIGCSTTPRGNNWIISANDPTLNGAKITDSMIGHVVMNRWYTWDELINKICIIRQTGGRYERFQPTMDEMMNLEWEVVK